MRKEKGITLIALIITIIVMLILVAVTITVALNGGVFDNAKNASDKTQRQAEKEELISAMVGAYDSTGNFATSNVGVLPGGAKWCNENTEVWSEDLDVNPTGNGDWIITPNNNKFYVDKSGSVLDEKPDTNPGNENEQQGGNQEENQEPSENEEPGGNQTVTDPIVGTYIENGKHEIIIEQGGTAIYDGDADGTWEKIAENEYRISYYSGILSFDANGDLIDTTDGYTLVRQ